jgi:hypothetical protein
MKESEDTNKSIDYQYLLGHVSDEEFGAYLEDIEKAKKGKHKVKKLYMREGKLVYGTFWMNNEEEVKELDEEKVGERGIITESISEGDKIMLKTKKKEIEGIVCGFSFNKKSKRHWIAVKDENGEVELIDTGTLIAYYKPNVANENIKSKYTFIMNLGGSTGAQLVQDEFGNKYVKKTGADAAHLQSEYEALRLYEYLGVRVPQIHEYDTAKAELYTEFINPAQKIGAIKSEGFLSAKLQRELKDNFAIDALLANWDVIGLEGDNVLITSLSDDKRVVRVDVGGSLDKRAQGANKTFGDEVTELDSLLDEVVNPKTAQYFKDTNIQDSIKNAIFQYDSKKHLIDSDNTIRQSIKDTLAKRVDDLRSRVQEDKVSDLSFQGTLYDIDPEYYDEPIVDFYDRLNKDMVLTESDVERVKNSEWYFSESSIQSFMNDHKNSGLVQLALKNGITPLELRIVNYFTTSSGAAKINSVASQYTTSINGDVNLDTETISYTEDESFEEMRVDEKIYLKDAFEKVLDAIKSLNYAKSQGKTTDSMNKAKLDAAKMQVKDIEEFAISGKANLTAEQSENIKILSRMKNMLTTAYEENVSVPHVTLPQVQDIDYQVVTQQKKKAGPNALRIRGFEDMDKDSVSQLKLLSHALTKMEQIRSPKYFKEGVYNRGISLNGEKQEKFDFQHRTPNQYVTHCWASSSAWEESGFTGDNKIHISSRKGIFIEEISEHSNEKEILNRPFSLFKTTSFAKDYGRTITHLLKIV